MCYGHLSSSHPVVERSVAPSPLQGGAAQVAPCRWLCRPGPGGSRLAYRRRAVLGRAPPGRARPFLVERNAGQEALQASLQAGQPGKAFPGHVGAGREQR